MNSEGYNGYNIVVIVIPLVIVLVIGIIIVLAIVFGMRKYVWYFVILPSLWAEVV